MMRKPKYTNCEPLLALLIFIRSKNAIVMPMMYSLPSTTGLRRALIRPISSMQKTFSSSAIEHSCRRQNVCLWHEADSPRTHLYVQGLTRADTSVGGFGLLVANVCGSEIAQVIRMRRVTWPLLSQ